MHYRIYIDTLFVTNLICNYLLLRLTGKWLKCSATHLRTVIGATLGAGSYCILIMLPGIPAGVKVITAYSVINLGMVIISFRPKSGYAIVRATATLFLFTIFCGGFLRWIFTQQPFLHKLEISSIMVLVSLTIVFILLKAVIKKHRENEGTVQYQVMLKIGNQTLYVTAILDTGNQLYEPISGRPVSVIEEEILHKYIEEGGVRGYCVIPYHSIGKANGMLEGYEIEEIEINTRATQIKRQKVVVAVSKEKVSASKQYQMILHPQLIEN